MAGAASDEEVMIEEDTIGVGIRLLEEEGIVEDSGAGPGVMRLINSHKRMNGSVLVPQNTTIAKRRLQGALQRRVLLFF